MKGGSKQKKDSLRALEKKNEADYKRLRAEVVNENQRFSLTTGGSINVNAENSSPNAATEVSNKLFPKATYASMDSTTNGTKFEQLVETMLSLYQGIDWENIRFDQIETYLQDPAKFTVLLDKIKTSLEALGKDIADDLLKNNVTVIKGKIKAQVKKVIDDLVKEFYDKESKK
ncbi:MAG TPA: hypothetical protein DCS93_13795 [Microscillaceae bacterium]|nr:hypothetical protein [Microscillaceae bacterium]